MSLLRKYLLDKTNTFIIQFTLCFETILPRFVTRERECLSRSWLQTRVNQSWRASLQKAAPRCKAVQKSTLTMFQLRALTFFCWMSSPSLQSVAWTMDLDADTHESVFDSRTELLRMDSERVLFTNSIVTVNLIPWIVFGVAGFAGCAFFLWLMGYDLVGCLTFP